MQEFLEKLCIDPNDPADAVIVSFDRMQLGLHTYFETVLISCSLSMGLTWLVEKPGM